MRAAGVETVVDSDELAIMGIVEVGLVLPRFVRAFRTLKQAALNRLPDAAILVDWPEFNLRLASALKRRGIKIVYYISPQLWAWRPRRIRNVKRDIDLLLSILPFEAAWYEQRGVSHVEFVGHPLAGEVQARWSRDEFCQLHNLDPARPTVAFLPGSRHKELVRILPPMLDAIEILNERIPSLQPVLVVAPSRRMDEVTSIIEQQKNAEALRKRLTVVHHETREALAASDAAAVASGTATLEAALLQTPMVVVYKESPINWHTLGRLIEVEHYGLVNLVAGERLATELMQEELTGQRLSEELDKLLDPLRNQAMRDRLKQVGHQLGEGGASKKAAATILDFLKNQEDG
jgi:lipid-A-disaccharide synthase